MRRGCTSPTGSAARRRGGKPAGRVVAKTPPGGKQRRRDIALQRPRGGAVYPHTNGTLRIASFRRHPYQRRDAHQRPGHAATLALGEAGGRRATMRAPVAGFETATLGRGLGEAVTAHGFPCRRVRRLSAAAAVGSAAAARRGQDAQRDGRRGDIRPRAHRLIRHDGGQPCKAKRRWTT